MVMINILKEIKKQKYLKRNDNGRESTVNYSKKTH